MVYLNTISYGTMKCTFIYDATILQTPSDFEFKQQRENDKLDITEIFLTFLSKGIRLIVKQGVKYNN